MKNYIVQNIYEIPVAYDEWFLVKAENKKDALHKVFIRYGYECKKTDFKVFTLEEFYENEDVVVIH
jgi:hypothetical protein